MRIRALLPLVLLFSLTAFAGPSKEKPLVYLIMAVSSMGKTTQGEKLAAHLKVPFYEPDDFHSEGNKKKMAAGQALTDEDRFPWLDRIKNEVIDKHLKAGTRAVAGCSALKRSYRKRLGIPNPKIQLVYLKGTIEMALANNRKRVGHFASELTVRNNFKILEEPLTEENAIVVPVQEGVEETFQSMLKLLNE